ncbi:hypothetical protein Tco_0656568 [Tanacetum coccineum]|uniref:Uncharacterized protein n=1 Tax=Tanacetum coccineum TaxID=301880 RepID=A0ABQ4X993_9ASTR
MTSPVIDLVTRPDSPNVHWPLPTTTTTTAAPPTTTLPLPPQPQQGSSDSILIKRMGELEQHIADLVEENQALETNKQGNRIHKLETIDWPKMIREQTVEFNESHEISQKIKESVKEVVIDSITSILTTVRRHRSFGHKPELLFLVPKLLLHPPPVSFHSSGRSVKGTAASELPQRQLHQLNALRGND